MFWRKKKPIERDGVGINWPARSFRDKPKKLKNHYEQRKARGFSDADWWSFDTYIAGVIGQAVAMFRDQGVGYPGDMNEESFAALCTEISEPLLRYAEDKFDIFDREEEEKVYNEAVEAMKKFSERLGCWWD